MAKATVIKKKTPVKTKRSKAVVKSTGLSPYKRINKKVLIAIIVIFAAIGLVTIFRSFAAVPTQKFKATDFKYNAYQEYIVSSDRNYAAMWWTGTGTKSVNLERDYKKLVVNARGSSCYGAAQMQVKIDGKLVLDRFVPETAFTAIPVNINVAGGAHTLEIGFLNDFGSPAIGKTPACDRNLYVESLTFEGTNILEPNTTVTDTVLSTILPDNFQYGKYGQVQSVSKGILWSNGTISATTTTTKNATSAVFYLSGSQCNGEPVVRVAINGTVVLEGGIKNTTAAAFVVPKTFAAGTQKVELTLLNDASGTNCNRNIYFSKVEFRGYVAPTQPAPPRPDPTPTPTPNPGSATTGCTAAGLTMCDDFESTSYPLGAIPDGDIKKTVFGKNWQLNQACPDRVSIENDPIRKGGKSVKMTVHNTDVDGKSGCPAAPNENPRAQMVTNPLFYDGDERYMSVSTFFPSDFPRDIGKKSYLQITELYGSPTKCGPPIGIFVVGSRIQFNQLESVSKAGDCSTSTVKGGVWKAPTDIQYGKAWEKFTLRVKFSTTDTGPNAGFIEIWYNGQKQKFGDGTERHYMRTLVPGVNYNAGGSNQLYVNSYRGATAFNGYVTLWHDDVKVGKTYESVQ